MATKKETAAADAVENAVETVEKAEVLEHSIKQDAEAARKSQAMQAAAGTQMMTI